MSITDCLEKMKIIQENLLDFLENESDVEENFQNLNISFIESKINEDKHDLRLLLHLIVTITSYHHHGLDFMSKIFRILQILLNDIKKFYTNSEIFNIFKSNKRILLFLIEEKIMVFDDNIVQIVTSEKYVSNYYPDYFLPEILPFINDEKLSKINKKRKGKCNCIPNQIADDFYEKRKEEKEENPIIKLIQQDSVKDFIAYINLNNVSIKSTVKRSIFDSNSFPDDKLSFIECAAFFGSVQIFRYLKLNGANLKDTLWPFAIHGKNPEIIKILEDEKILPPKQSSFGASIKCHHNEIVVYLRNNYFLNTEDKFDTFHQSLKYYNFALIQSNLINQASFFDLYQYDYYPIVKILLETTAIDINNVLIHNETI